MLPLVLLVDDEEEILLFLERILRDAYTVLKAENGQQALQLLEQEAVQLIVSDIMMPVVDGLELCRIVKSNTAYAHIPVILLTAKSGIQAKVDGLNLGADVYIEKPFSKEVLLAQMASLLVNRNNIREHYAASPLVNLKSGVHSKSDTRFLETVNSIIAQNLEDPALDVEKLAKEMNMSRITLYRKIKVMSNLTPVELINNTRLKRAAELLTAGDYKMYEVADLVGFTSQSQFTRSFLRHFDMTPTEYLHQTHAKKQF